MLDPSEHASSVFNILKRLNSDHNVKPAARSVAFWLTQHMNRETHMCWPSLDRLCQLTGFHRETVAKAIQNLESAGYIEIMREPGKANTYSILEQDKWVSP